MTPEGTEQAASKGFDVDDPEQRALWRAECLLHNRKNPHIDRPMPPWSAKDEERHRAYCRGLIAAANYSRRPGSCTSAKPIQTNIPAK